METNTLQMPHSGPALLEIEITTACNKRCSFCYLSRELGTAFMPVRQAGTVLHQARDCGVEHVVLTGGEVLLHPELEEIVALANSLGFTPGLLSNGKALAETHLRQYAGRASFLQLSLNGLPRAQSDACEIYSKLKTWKGQLLPLTVLITIGAQSPRDLPELISLAETLGMPFGLQRLCTMGQEELLKQRPTCTEYAVILQRVAESMQTNSLMACEDPLLNRFMDPDLADPAGEFCRLGCSAGRWAAAVTVTGELIPCVKLRLADRNVFEVGLQQAWQTSKVLQHLRERKADSVCGGCRHFPVCRGCRAEAYYSTSDLWGPDPLCLNPTV